MKNEKSSVIIWNINNNAWNNGFLLNVYIDIIFWREFFDSAGKFLCRVPYGQALGKAIRKKKEKNRCRVLDLKHSAMVVFFFFLNSFAECRIGALGKEAFLALNRPCPPLSLSSHTPTPALPPPPHATAVAVASARCRRCHRPPPPADLASRRPTRPGLHRPARRPAAASAPHRCPDPHDKVIN